MSKQQRKCVKTTMEELRSKIEAAIVACDGDKDSGDFDGSALLDYLYKDIKVRVDCENFYSTKYEVGGNSGDLAGFQDLGNGLTFWGCVSFGDWETPCFFAVYFDGKRLRAYVPTDGNPFNTDTMQAFGNDPEGDDKNLAKRGMVGAQDFDWMRIRTDIEGRLVARSDPATRKKPRAKTIKQACGVPVSFSPSASEFLAEVPIADADKVMTKIDAIAADNLFWGKPKEIRVALVSGIPGYAEIEISVKLCDKPPRSCAIVFERKWRATQFVESADEKRRA